MFVGWPAGRRLGEIMGPWLEAVGSTLLLIFLTVRIHAAADLSCSTCGKHCHFGIIERDFPSPGGGQKFKKSGHSFLGSAHFFFHFRRPLSHFGLLGVKNTCVFEP